MSTQAKKIAPAGDTPRRQADAINQHAEMITHGLRQTRTVAELAEETHEDGRSFYCPDDSGGPCIAVSSNGAWKKLTLGGTVS
jgi:hypothetical protein